MDRMGWGIKWSAPLIPDLACVPGNEVFLEDAGHFSLTAGSRGKPGLLFASPDILLKCANQAVKKRKKKEARRRKTRRYA